MRRSDRNCLLLSVKEITNKSGGLLDSVEGQISRILAGYELIYEALLNNFQSPTIRT